MIRTTEVQPVILCGGTGTRLWPLSRQSYPKQFCALSGGDTLFRQTVARATAIGARPPVIVTNEAYRFIAAEQAEGRFSAIILEPLARNTAPAICLAALERLTHDPEALLLVMPSDHVIGDEAAFGAAVAAAVPAAASGDIVIFGVHPGHAATGYGYIACDPAAEGVTSIRRFVEKPAADEAQAMLAAGGHLWNAGLFLMRADAAVEAFRNHAPEVLAHCQRAFAGCREDADFLRPDPAALENCPSISFDHAVMERAARLVVPVEMGWSDLGAWDAVWEEGGDAADENGVVEEGETLAIDCRDTLLRSDAEGIRLIGLGLEGLVAVATRDAVLVADKSRAGEVGKVVEALKLEAAPQALESARCHRPWGWYESLALGDRFQVKRIAVKPGGRLSLQSHHHRAEHWVVVSGTARVTVGDSDRILGENQSVFIPLGEVHRLENPGRSNCTSSKCNPVPISAKMTSSATRTSTIAPRLSPHDAPTESCATSVNPNRQRSPRPEERSQRLTGICNLLYKSCHRT